MLKDNIEKRIRELDKKYQQKKGKEKFFFPFSEEIEIEIKDHGEENDKTSEYNSEKA